MKKEKRKYTKKPKPQPPSDALSDTRKGMKEKSKYNTYADIPELIRGDIENLILSDARHNANISPDQRRQRALEWWRKCG